MTSMAAFPSEYFYYHTSYKTFEEKGFVFGPSMNLQCIKHIFYYIPTPTIASVKPPPPSPTPGQGYTLMSE